MDQRLNALQSHARTVRQSLATHPRRVYGAITAALLGFAAAAVAIAPLAPDAADLPKRMVIETVTPLDIQPQLDALAEHELELSRSDLTRATDTVDSLLKRLGVTDPQAAAFMREDAQAKRLLQGRNGKMVQVTTDQQGRLTELVARFPAASEDRLLTHFSRLSVNRLGEGFRASLTEAPLESRVMMGGGVIQQSLFAATDEARIPDVIASQMADIFSGDINFTRDLRREDRFSVVYETLTADGEAITWNQGSGRVLAAEFVNKGRSFTALWFKDNQGKGGYYDAQGQSRRRAYLSSPLPFSRITSGFAMRFHPILRKWRSHDGVDFAAPTGTPVRSVGDGVIDFAGWQNGYGNVVHVRHNKDHVTVYAHLSKMLVKRGQRVEQGDHIGLVGATGWATGPHLHFEFKVGGRQTNPLVLAKMGETQTLSASARAQFMVASADLRRSLELGRDLSNGLATE